MERRLFVGLPTRVCHPAGLCFAAAQLPPPETHMHARTKARPLQDAKRLTTMAAAEHSGAAACFPSHSQLKRRRLGFPDSGSPSTSLDAGTLHDVRPMQAFQTSLQPVATAEQKQLGVVTLGGCTCWLQLITTQQAALRPSRTPLVLCPHSSVSGDDGV